MLADPDAHRGVTVTSDDLGEPGCTRWSVRPVLGPLGRLAGWWRVRISSGCPCRRTPAPSLAGAATVCRPDPSGMPQNLPESC